MSIKETMIIKVLWLITCVFGVVAGFICNYNWLILIAGICSWGSLNKLVYFILQIRYIKQLEKMQEEEEKENN